MSGLNIKKSTQIYFVSIAFAAITMLTSVGLVSTGAWLISMAALMPPILTLQVAIVGVRAFGISRAVFRWLERVTSHDAALGGITELRVKLWNAAAVLGPRGIWRMRGSDALDRLTSDIDIMQDRFTRVRVPFAAAALAAVLLIWVQPALLPIAGLLLLISFLISGVLVPVLTARVDMRVARDQIHVRDEISRAVSSAANRSNEFQVLGLSEHLVKEVSLLDAQRVHVETRSAVMAGVANVLNGLSAALAIFGGLAFAITANETGELKGVLVAVVALLPWSAAEIVATFSQATQARTKVALAAARIADVINAADLQLENAEPLRTQILASPSVFEASDLSVSWDDKLAVSGVNFEVRRGERFGIVGPSGSGKSSVAAALLRLVEHRGSISLDSVPIDRLMDFRSHVTAVLQTTHIFHASVKENLLVANPHASEARMISALHDAGLQTWFEGLPDGLETVLGDSARGMSGGEIQRFGLARALTTDSAFIILDEPTEHLDQDTADSIWQTVNRLFHDRGLIIISHDPRIAMDCDQVMVLDLGRVVEHDSPNNLKIDGWLHRMAEVDGLIG